LAELLIIADDLTGAIEAGVQLSKNNITAEVVIDSDTDLQNVLSNKNITALIVNTESRHLLPEEAAVKIYKVLDSVTGYGIKWYFKKTDSTMRGNIGSELEAFMNGTGQSVLPYIPAHPKLKRFTRDGFQYIENSLLHKTSFANDPLEPARVSFVPDILNNQSKVVINLSDPKGRFFENSSVKNKKIMVFNCNSESDLQIIGKTILNNGWQNALAGTAGLVEILPGILPLSSSKIELKPIIGPILFVNGSLNSVSQNQVQYAKNYGVVTLSLSQSQFSISDFKNTDAFKKITEKIRMEYKNGKNVIISTTDSVNSGISVDSINRNHKLFSKQTGKIISAILNEIRISTLCVFGGDTLMGIMKEAGGKYFEAKNEILPGVAHAKTNISAGTIHILSKPGGYGEKDIILKIINHVKYSDK
jgi:D-threonate/D-erythronate kinase